MAGILFVPLLHIWGCPFALPLQFPDGSGEVVDFWFVQLFSQENAGMTSSSFYGGAKLESAEPPKNFTVVFDLETFSLNNV